MFKQPLWQTVWTQIRLLLGAVCSGSTLFASILNLSVMLGNYLQQTTSAEDIFRCIIFLGALRVNSVSLGYALFLSAVLHEAPFYFFHSSIFYGLCIVTDKVGYLDECLKS